MSKKPWSPADRERLLEGVRVHGHNWGVIASKCLPGRSAKSIAAYFYRTVPQRVERLRRTQPIPTTRIKCAELRDFVRLMIAYQGDVALLALRMRCHLSLVLEYIAHVESYCERRGIQWDYQDFHHYAWMLVFMPLLDNNHHVCVSKCD